MLYLTQIVNLKIYHHYMPISLEEKRNNDLRLSANFLKTDYKSLVDELPAAVYTCDMNGYLTSYNKAATILWGQHPTIGGALWSGSLKLYNPSGLPLLHSESPISKCLKLRKPIDGSEVVIERADGRRLNVLVHPKPLYDDSGEMIGAMNVLVDITHVKKDQAEIFENQRYYKMVEEVENYAIILLTVDGNILNWNVGAHKIKGYSEDEIVGKHFSVFYTENDKKSGLPNRLISQAASEGKAVDEGWRMRKDGTKFWGNILITALHDQEDHIIGFSKVTRDLTDKKLADDQLLAYSKGIELQNRQLEEFAFVASHDLQEPLRKIRIFSDMVHSNLHDTALIEKNLLKINSSAQRMSILISDILKYSQLAQFDNLFEQTDLNAIIKSVKDDLDILIAERDAKIIHGDFPTINAIPIQMNQLFHNLISNSIKFSEGQPQLKIISKTQTCTNPQYIGQIAGRDYLHLEFSDNGIGFDDKYGAEVFKLFQRLHSDKKGTGIGLALVKKIIDNHQGSIEVHSEVNRGTTFNIILPV